MALRPKLLMLNGFERNITCRTGSTGSFLRSKELVSSKLMVQFCILIRVNYTREIRLFTSISQSRLIILWLPYSFI